MNKAYVQRQVLRRMETAWLCKLVGNKALSEACFLEAKHMCANFKPSVLKDRAC